MKGLRAYRTGVETGTSMSASNTQPTPFEGYTKTLEDFNNRYRTSLGTYSENVTDEGPGSPDWIQAQVIKNRQKVQERLYRPLEGDMLRSLTDTSMVSDARKSIDQGFRGLREQASREDMRYGIQTSASQRNDFNRRLDYDRALTMVGGVNNARLNQLERNDALRSELLQVGRDIDSGSLNGLSNSASLQNSRTMMNERAKAAAEAADAQAYGNMASTAIMAYAILAASDIRLKTDVQVLGEIGGLPLVSWTWNSTANALGFAGRSIGFIAQDVEQRYPEHVGPFLAWKGVDYAGLLRRLFGG